MRNVLVILSIGVVIWWFVKPGANGIQFVAGLWTNAIQFLQFLTTGK